MIIQLATITLAQKQDGVVAQLATDFTFEPVHPAGPEPMPPRAVNQKIITLIGIRTNS